MKICYVMLKTMHLCKIFDEFEAIPSSPKTIVYFLISLIIKMEIIIPTARRPKFTAINSPIQNKVIILATP